MQLEICTCCGKPKRPKPGLVVSSPPYVDVDIKASDAKKRIERIRQAVSEGRITGRESLRVANSGFNENTSLNSDLADYGQTDGQLGAMKPGDIQAVISSPPFAGNSGGRGEASRNGKDPGLFDRHGGGMKGGMGDEPGNLGNLPMGSVGAVIGSPPYAEQPTRNGKVDETAWSDGRSRTVGPSQRTNEGYGGAPGQLGNMAVIGSPPFADSVGSDDPDKRGGLFRDEKRRNDTNLTGTYGQTEGQLGGMKAGAIISSPPYAETNQDYKNGYKWAKPQGGTAQENYGNSPDQLTAGSPDTFWSAAKTIIDQCYQILPPNGAAIFVVKNYIKNGAEVDFTGQWQQLCEACGFETVHIHRAMLVKDNGEQETMAAGHDTTGTTTNLLGEEVTTAGKPMLNKKNIVARKSFFRRLHERKNPHLAIDFETVLCMRKQSAFDRLALQQADTEKIAA